MTLPCEIWFFKGSPAEALARALGRPYVLRPVERPSGRRGRSRAPSDGPSGRAVWLADPVANSAVLCRLARRQPELRLIAVMNGRSARSKLGREWFACLPRNSPAVTVERAVAAAFASVDLAQRERAARDELQRAEREREELNRIGVALSSTHDVAALLEMILAKTREITGADAGSLYVVETAPPENGGSGKRVRRLRFKLTQNDSKQFRFAEYTLPIDEDSLAGYAALHGEVVALGDRFTIEGSGFRGDADLDRVRIGDQPALVLAASPVSVVALANPRTAVGPANLTVEMQGDGASSMRVTVVSLALTGTAKAISTGERSVLTVRVAGSMEPLLIEVRNLSPNVVRLRGGNVERLTTSGGEPNAARVELTSVRSGDYSISARLVPVATARADAP